MNADADTESGLHPTDGEPLPAYTPSDGTAPYVADSDDDENTDSGVGNSPRGRYAMQVQRACRNALREVKKDNMLVTSEWAEPLTAAPTAISVMAFLIKMAADKKVAGLPVKNQIITKGEEGNEIVGRLPSPYFHTNLMHCSDVGRLAFIDAQKRMHKINTVSKSMMKDGGRISYIVELLEDVEDARDNLKPEMELLKKEANDCSNECKEIQKKFEYWHLVINHLSLNASELLGDKKIEQTGVQSSKHNAEVSERIHTSEEKKILQDIRDLERQARFANERIAKADAELLRLRSLPPLPEISHYEDVRMAQELSPFEDLSIPDRGMLSNAWSYVAGKSKKHQREDEELREAHHAKHIERQNRIIEEERARRRQIRKQLKDERNAARNDVENCERKREEKQVELANKRDRLAEAQAKLAKASADLKRLGRQELELDEIIGILQTSTNELGQLKAQLGRLVTFFGAIETNINDNAMKDVDNFLNSVNRNIKMKGEEVQSIKLRGPTKRRVLSSALTIQGQFSAIADVSAAYVVISNKFIRQAIDKMENLATIDDSKWDEERDKFTKWCDEAVVGINGVTKEACTKMAPNMQKRIGMLKTLAIEGAEENED